MSDLSDAARGSKKPTSRVYTDADVRRNQNLPGQTIYGPWETAPGGRKPTKAGDKGYFGPGNEDLNLDPLDLEAAQNMSEPEINVPGQMHGAPVVPRTGTQKAGDVAAWFYGDDSDNSTLGKIRGIAKVGAWPLAMVPGLGAAGLAADAYLTAEGIAGAAKNPSLGNIAAAAIPAAFGATRYIRGGKAGMAALRGLFSKSAGNVAGEALHGAEAFSDVASRLPKATTADRLGARVSTGANRVGFREPTPFNPAEAHLPNTPGSGAPATLPGANTDGPIIQHFYPNTPGTVSNGLSDSVDALFRDENVVSRHMPNTPGTVSNGISDSVNPLFRDTPKVATPHAASPHASVMDQVDRYMPNTPGDAPINVANLPTSLQELSHPGAQSFMNREFEANNPVFKKMEAQGAFSGDRTTGVRPGGPQLPKPAPPLQRNALDDAFDRQTARRARQREAGGLNQLMEDGAAKRPNGRPQVQKVPMGQHGNEYAGVKPFDKEPLTPEEQAAAPEFWDQVLAGLMHAGR